MAERQRKTNRLRISVLRGLAEPFDPLGLFGFRFSGIDKRFSQKELRRLVTLVRQPEKLVRIGDTGQNAVPDLFPGIAFCRRGIRFRRLPADTVFGGPRNGPGDRFFFTSDRNGRAQQQEKRQDDRKPFSRKTFHDSFLPWQKAG